MRSSFAHPMRRLSMPVINQFGDIPFGILMYPQRMSWIIHKYFGKGWVFETIPPMQFAYFT